MDVNCVVEGKGQGYKTQFTVDPRDCFEKSLRQNTHFWKTLVMRSNTYVVLFTNKNTEDVPIHPDTYG